MIRVEMVFGATTYYFSNAPLDYADKYWEPRVINDVELSRQLIDTEKSGSYARSVTLRLNNRDGLFDTLYTNNGLLNQYVTVYFGDGSVASKRLTGTIEKINEFGLDIDIVVTESILPYLEQNIPDEQIAYDYYSDMGINDSWEAVPIVFGTVRRHKTVPIDYVNFRYAIGSGEIYKIHKIYFGTTVIYNGDSSPVENGYQPEVDGITVKARIFKGAGWGGAPETITDNFGTHTSQFPGIAYIEFYDATTGLPTSPQLTDNSDPEVFVDVSGIVNAAKTDAERNPAQLIYWLLTNPTTARNISGGGPNGWGLGVPSELVSCTTAIADCASLGFKVDGVVDTIKEGREWIDELAKSCRGYFSEEEGVYTLSIDKAKGASVATFDESGAEGYNCSVNPWNEPELSQQINRLKVKFALNRETGNFDKIPDPTTIYTEDSTHALRINKWNNNSIELPFVQDEVTAAKLGQYYFKKVIKQLKEVSITTEVNIPDSLDKGSHVKVTASKYLWNAKSFIVQEIRKSETKTILRLKEYDSTVYDYTSVTLNYPTPIVPPSIYDIPSKPTNFTVSSSASIADDGSTKVSINLSAVKPTVNAQAVVFFRKKVGDSNFSYFTQSFTGNANYQWDRESGCYYIRAVTLSPTGVYSKIDISAGDTHYIGQPNAETYLEVKGDLIAPGNPTITVNNIINGASILLNITGGIPSDFSHFSVERAPACCGAPDCNNICIFNASAKSQLLTDIQANGCYSCWFYRVKAYDNSCNASCYSSWSSMVCPLKVDKKDIVFGAVDVDILTAGQIYGKDFRTACNVGNGSVSGVKFDTYGIEGWNGSTKNFCLSAVNGLLYAQNATISGAITATSGTFTGTICAGNGCIAGWTIGTCKLYAGEVGLNSCPVAGTISIYAGCCDSANAPFRVTNSGLLIASNACIAGTICSGVGYIGGWTINTDNLSGSTAGKGAVSLYKSGYIGVYRCETDSCYGAITLGNCLRLGSGWSNLYNGINIIKNGSVDVFSAYTRLSDNCFIGKIAGWTFTDSALSANNITLNSTGSIYTSNFASGLRGWCVSCAGNAEFNNVVVRGELRSSVFSYDEITAVGGQMLIAEAGLLANCWTTPALNACNAMCVKNSPAGTGVVFAANDIIRVKTFNSAGVADSWAKVISATACTGYYLYCVQLMSGYASSTIPAGVAVANYGPATTSAGAILLNGQGNCSPYIDVFTNGTTPWSGLTPRVRMGSLSGIAGMSGYGLWTNNGYIVGGVVQSTNWGTSAGSCFDLTGGCFSLGGSASPKLSWNGTTLSVSGNITITGGSGIANFTDAGALATVDNLDGVPDGSMYAKVGKGGSLFNNYSTTGCMTGWYNIGNGLATVTKNGASVIANQITTTTDVETLSDYIPIDPSKTYQVSISICRTVCTGSSYFGIYVFDGALNQICVIPIDSSGYCGTANNNFYFWFGYWGTSTGWRDFVGYLLPNDVSSQDIPPGKCVFLNAIMPANARYVKIRYLNFYNDGVSNTQYFFSPSIVPVDVSQSGKVYKGLDNSGTLISRVVPASAATPGTGTGLFLGCDYLGYYDGSCWKTYMDNTGKFYLSGASGGLAWDGTSLTVCGTVCATAGNIGGWTLSNGYLYGGTAACQVGIDMCARAGVSYWAGCNDPTSAPFRVYNCGYIFSCYGSIGGWSITGNTLSSTNTYGRMELFSSHSTFGMPMIEAGGIIGATTRWINMGHIYWNGGYKCAWGFSVYGDGTNSFAVAHTLGTGVSFPDGCAIGCDKTFFWIGNTDKFMKWDSGSGDLVIKGTVCATAGCFTGSITSTSGSIGGWCISSTCLYSQPTNTIALLDPSGLCFCRCFDSGGNCYAYLNINNNIPQMIQIKCYCYNSALNSYQWTINCVFDCGIDIVACYCKAGAYHQFTNTYFNANQMTLFFGDLCLATYICMDYYYPTGILSLNTITSTGVACAIKITPLCISMTENYTIKFKLTKCCLYWAYANPYICALGAVCFVCGIIANNLCSYNPYADRTSNYDMLNLEVYNSSPYAGSGSGIAFRGKTYRSSTSYVLSRIYSRLNDDSTNTYGSSLHFQTTETDTSTSPTTQMSIFWNGNIGVGTTSPAFSPNNARFFTVNNPATNGYTEFGIGGNITVATCHAGGYSFINTALATTEKRIISLLGATIGNTCSGRFSIHTANNGSLGERLVVDNNGSVTICSGVYMPLQLRTGSSGPWAIDLYRTDTSFSSKVYNDGAKWYFQHRPSFAGNTPWDSGNDGAGSGLDADYVDGYHAADLFRLNAVNYNSVSCCNGYVFTVCNACDCLGYGLSSSAIIYAIYGVASGNWGVVGYSMSSYAVLGCACACYGVYGHAITAYPVGGNGAYYNASTRTLKSGFEEVEVLPSLRCLCITRWTWMDTNQTTHDEFIGPVAEDVQQAFKLTFANDGIYQLDGIALKAAQELDTCVTDLKACISSLTDCINTRLSLLEAKLQ